METLDLFAAICSHKLGLEYPVKLTYCHEMPALLGLAECEGGYTEGDGVHLVFVKLGATRGELEIIAHEFVHAYCVEWHPMAKDHGYTFRRACQRLRSALLAEGIIVRPLYLKGTDK
jgi:hypothetical protein